MSTTLLLLTALWACGGSAETEAPETPVEETEVAKEEGEADATDERAKILAALSQRKPEPRCQDVDKMSSNPVAIYSSIIETETEPTFAPMRAATCMISHHPREAEVEALKWVVDPSKASLTTLVLARLDTMPLDSAKKIAEAALGGPHTEIAKTRIARLRTPELKALAAASE